MAAHGGTVVEIRKATAANGRWCATANTTAASPPTTPRWSITGPAAGHDRMQDQGRPDRHEACSACSTTAPAASRPGAPGSSAEENSTAISPASSTEDHPEAANYKRYGVPGNAPMTGAKYHDRFDLAKEPNEPNRFGWIVEIDPFDPDLDAEEAHRARAASSMRAPRRSSTRTAGYVVYIGDDERFDYVYKFVTKARSNASNRAANMDLLDERHAVGRQIRRRRHGRLAAARLRPGPADRRERLWQPGRRADRDAARRRPARRHQDGPARGRRGQSRRPARSMSC